MNGSQSKQYAELADRRQMYVRRKTHAVLAFILTALAGAAVLGLVLGALILCITFSTPNCSMLNDLGSRTVLMIATLIVVPPIVTVRVYFLLEARARSVAGIHYLPEARRPDPLVCPEEVLVRASDAPAIEDQMLRAALTVRGPDQFALLRPAGTEPVPSGRDDA